MPARRDFLKLAAAGITAAALHKWLPAGAEGSASPPLIWRGSSRHRYVALTYDDCYLVKRLQGLEALLAEFPDFKITLFPVGVALLNNEQKDPGIWKRFHAQGHEIGYHSWDHTNFGVMSEQTALEDYARWLEALTKVLGATPSVHFGRPTFGSLSPSFDAVCKAYGLVNTMWSTGWGGELSVGLNAAKRSRNGDIVLASPDWHPGVIGIVASRLTEEFHRPAILIALKGKMGKGSGRSIPSFSLYQALKSGERWMERFGGHEQAVGLVISLLVKRVRNVTPYSLGLAFGSYVLSAFSGIFIDVKLEYLTAFKHLDPAYIIKNGAYDTPLVLLNAPAVCAISRAR